MSDVADTVHQMADQLRQYATHFAFRDWDYTRDVGDLRPLHFGSRWPSIGAALRYLVCGVTHIFPEEPKMRPGRWAMVRAALRSYDNEPDGVLDDGAVITIWEETGEYLQYVQPSVGALIADLMDAHPNLTEVRVLAAEMKRINDRYGARVAGEGGEAA
jgi:hypothetical protein